MTNTKGLISYFIMSLQGYMDNTTLKGQMVAAERMTKLLSRDKYQSMFYRQWPCSHYDRQSVSEADELQRTETDIRIAIAMALPRGTPTVYGYVDIGLILSMGAEL